MPHSASQSGFEDYAQHLVELRSLAARGMNDSAEADDVRDAMDEPWTRLRREDISRARGLAGDLHTVGVDRSAPATVSYEHAQGLASLRDLEDWDGLLEMLREHEAELPPADVARLRGICWQQLGLSAVAVIFFHEATRISPDEAINEVLELKALVAAGRTDEAVSRAQIIMMPGPHESTIRLLEASSVLFQAADTTEGIDSALLQQSIDAAERGLKLGQCEPVNEILQEMCRSTCLRLSLGYLQQGNQQKARAACEKALNLAPDDRDALILLAWIEREENPELAEQHFRSGFLQQLNRGSDWNMTLGPLLPSTET